VKTIPLTLFAIGALLADAPTASTPLGVRSAEETVALMIWGLEATSRADRLNTWKIEHRDGDRVTFSVLRRTDCLFSASVERHLARTGHVLKFDYSFDFARVREYSAWFANGKDERVITKIEGSRWYDQKVINKADGRTVHSIPGGSIHTFVAGGSIERLQAAFEDFRINHCQERPL